jgi:hypothetical protein
VVFRAASCPRDFRRCGRNGESGVSCQLLVGKSAERRAGSMQLELA